jgi:hypothetical protein
VLLTNYYLGDQITKNEMGRTSGTYGGEEKCIWGFGDETPRCYLEDLGIDGRILLKWVFKKWDGGMDWIDLV